MYAENSILISMAEDFLENKMYRKYTIRDGIKAENARLSVCPSDRDR